MHITGERGILCIITPSRGGADEMVRLKHNRGNEEAMILVQRE